MRENKTINRKGIGIVMGVLLLFLLCLLPTLPAYSASAASTYQAEQKCLTPTGTVIVPTTTPTALVPASPTISPTITPTSPTAGTPTPLPTTVPTSPSSPGGSAALQIADTSLEFQAQAESISDLSFSIKNTSSEPIIWLLAKPEGSAAWIRIPSATPQEIGPAQETRTSLQIDTHGLGAGTYLGMVLLISSGQPIVGLSLKMTVVAGAGTPVPSPTPPTQVSLLFNEEEEKVAKKGTPTPVVCVTPTPSVTPTPQTPVGSTATSEPAATATATNSAGASCGASSPYGITTINADGQLVAAYEQLGICWVRYQLSVTNIETSPGVYDWTVLDKVVATMNKAGIHMNFPLRCFIGSCFSSPQLPTPEHMAQFAEAIATRYDGKHGHGVIDAFQIGNEEYDFFPISAYGPLLKAGYEAIKKANPEALVGMYGPFKPSLSHMQNVFQYLGNYNQYFDYAGFHYYARGQDPRGPGNNLPSYREVWQEIHRIIPDKPIWVTEIGWPTKDVPCCKAVSPQQQAEYLRYIMTESAQSGVIEKVFWFTLNYGSQGNTIYPPEGPLPAFFEYQQIVRQFPIWSSQGSDSASSGGRTPILTSVIPPATDPSGT